MRGRVSAVNSMFVGSSNELGGRYILLNVVTAVVLAEV
jgi:hypothetical protein